MFQRILLVILTLIPLFSFASDSVIYGEDDRKDYYEVENEQFKTWSESTAAMFDQSSLKDNGDSYLVVGETMEDMGICKSEKFSQQFASAYCSGFLVGENLLVTAGHCIKGNSDCQKYLWVFDYKMQSRGQTEIEIEKSNVYSCKKVIERKLDGMGADYALIELDREVDDRNILDYRKGGKVNVGESLVVIGHPTGLPTKIADGAKVRSQKSTGYFIANLDTYGGNSGSAVFNEETGEVEGILVRGETDYVRKGNCLISNKCADDGCRGEDVTKITEINYLQ